MNPDVARAGFDVDGGSAAVDFAGDVMMTVDGPLDEHLLVGVNFARAGGCFK